MTIEELLQPRYLVIADYPHSPYDIGDLIAISDTGTSFHCTTTQEYDEFQDDIVPVNHYFSIDKIGIYKTLFHPLQWWEHRKPEDMPEYVNHVQTGKILIVAEWDLENTNGWICKSGIHSYHRDVILPSCKTEYAAYLATPPQTVNN